MNPVYLFSVNFDTTLIEIKNKLKFKNDNYSKNIIIILVLRNSIGSVGKFSYRFHP